MFAGKNKDEERSYRIGKNILKENDLKIQITYKSDVFTLKYPNPIIKAAIEAEIARRLGGYPRSSFSSEHVSMVEACVIVDLLMISEECPTWFEGPWTCYDENLITSLYTGYFQFRNKFREKLRTGGLEGRSKEDSP